MKKLADVYDANIDIVGRKVNNQPILVPISHLQRHMQIEIMVDGDGNFVNAWALDKGEESYTIFGVTEDSDNASNNFLPKPLFDHLPCVAGDYFDYFDDEKMEKEHRHDQYLLQLKDWVESPYSNDMIKAIYAYGLKKSMMADLIQAGVLKTDASGCLDPKQKIQGKSFDKMCVRFSVYLSADEPTDIWNSIELQNDWMAYYNDLIHKTREPELCCVTGERVICAKTYPFRIRSYGDRAKIISANDDKGLTYLGRFESASQAFTVGYLVLQKGLAALRWLIQKQGHVYRDGSVFVAWSSLGNKLPDISLDFVSGASEIMSFDDMDLDRLDIPDSGYTGKDVVDAIWKNLNGYIKNVDVKEDTYVLMLDSLTKGRLSIVYWSEDRAANLLRRTYDWYDRCAWEHWVSFRRKRRFLDCSPSLSEMILVAYGYQTLDRGVIVLDCDPSIMRNSLKLLLSCVTKGSRIPDDMILSAFENASRPHSFSQDIWMYEVIPVACAMIKGNYVKDGGDMSCFFESNVGDRSVLFGRLLAAYDYAQKRAFYRKWLQKKVAGQVYDSSKSSETCAKNHWESFVVSPASTLALMQDNLNPYLSDLKQYERNVFEHLIEELMTYLAECDGYNNDTLSELYLPAYYIQMKELRAQFAASAKAYKASHPDVDTEDEKDIDAHLGLDPEASVSDDESEA